MPRRNRRESFEPLDLTPPRRQAANPPSPRYARAYIQRLIDEDERRQRQAKARELDGIDWSACLVTGCERNPVQAGYRLDAAPPERRDHTMELPLCGEHLAVAYHQVRESDDPVMVDAVAAVVQRRQEQLDTRERAAKQAHLARRDGQIYYVRLNGLIKVGWTRTITDRLRAYGPNVEVLCHYSATLNDETDLHRQLVPFRAKGREWYHDCPALRDFVEAAVKLHGPPTESAWWSEPKDVIASKNKNRRS